MNKMFNGLTAIFVIFFILILCTLVILVIFGAIDKDTMTDSLLKVGATLLVLTIASFAISWLQGSKNK